MAAKNGHREETAESIETPVLEERRNLLKRITGVTALGVLGANTLNSALASSFPNNNSPSVAPLENHVYDLLIKNGLVILENGEIYTDIAVKDGKIAAIGISLTGAKNIIDAAGLIVSPGMIDAHVHISEPGGGVRDDREGYVTGTRACARGGVTTIIDMPVNQLPATVDKKTLEIKYAAGKGKLTVDVASHGGLGPNNLEHNQIKELSDGGVAGYKCFMSTSGDRSIKDDLYNVDDYSLLEGMRQIATTGKILMIHAENAAITDRLGQLAQSNGEISLKAYAASRPEYTEVEAVRRALLFAKITGCPINFCHMSSPASVAEVIKGREEGVNVTCETCNQYLCFVTDDLEKIGTAAKCSPPVRDKVAQDGLWRHVLAGHIDFITSDHSPCPAALKDKPSAFQAWGGIAGVQNDVDIFFDEAVQKRGMTLKHFAEMISSNVADRFALTSKGRISVGKDADFVFIKPKCSYTLTKEDLEYRNKISAFVGRKIGAQVVRTILRGHIIYEQERGVTSDFHGLFIKV